MELWIARSEDGFLTAFTHKPLTLRGVDWMRSEGSSFSIPMNLFPEVTWENSPRKVKIELV